MPLSARIPSTIAWLPWGISAFARARAEDKPVLLSLVTSWSSACREMDETTFASTRVAAAIEERFVPVRVDADRRPDLSERYTLGGWPTTAFLTAEGEVLGGGTAVAEPRMHEVLTQVTALFDSRPRRTAPDRADPGEARECGESDLLGRVFESYDERHGGFGDEPKFPLVAPVRLALDLWTETQNPRLHSMVVTTLGAIGSKGLYDPVDGGFFRYCASRDWSRPRVEKLLEVNAGLVGLFVDASTVLGIQRLADGAADALRFTQTWLSDSDGGWYGSQFGDERYFHASSSEERAALGAPSVDATFFTDANAAMVAATLRAASAFDDGGLKQYAIHALERVLLAAYQPGAGVAHYHDGRARVRGLLADQMAMASASLDAHEATGNVVYEMMAEELAHFAVRTMWDEPAGGFFDRAADAADDDDGEPIGLLRERLKPFVSNCEAARLLIRLARSSGEAEFGERARRALAVVAPQAHRHGATAAHYLLALRDLRRSDPR